MHPCHQETNKSHNYQTPDKYPEIVNSFTLTLILYSCAHVKLDYAHVNIYMSMQKRAHFFEERIGNVGSVGDWESGSVFIVIIISPG